MDAKTENAVIAGLAKALKERRISVPKFEAQTGIPKDRVYKWLKRKDSRISHEDAELVNKWIAGDLDRVPRGKSYVEMRNHHKNTAERKIPLFDAPAAAGNTNGDLTPISAPAGTIDVGDLLHDSEAAIRIYGNSMIPNYPPGCVVGLAKCSSKFIEPGEVYVIETRDRRILKRLFYKDDDQESDFLMCYSDNTMVFEGGVRNGKPAYPPFNLPKDEIVGIFTVTGVIKRNANSVIINRK